MENKKVCQACKGYLFEDDDIVVCPECGAPHHRECYSALGRCGVEVYHGTPNQYDLLLKRKSKQENDEKTKVICPNCGKLCKDSENFCHNCSFPLKSGFQQQRRYNASPIGGGMVINIDPYAGFSPETVVDDNVTVGDVKEFVGVNSNRYIPKFMLLKGSTNKKANDSSNKNKSIISWNWPAFLLPSSWFFYRKLYFQGVGMLILEIASAMCSLPLTDFVYESMPASASAQTAIDYSAINYEKALLPVMLFFLGCFIMLVVHLISGMFANIIYKKHCVNIIKETKASFNGDDLKSELLKKGGVNFWLMLISFLASTWLPQILYAFI